MGSIFRRNGQFDTQRFALVLARVINRGVHHIVDGVHQAGHVLQGEVDHEVQKLGKVAIP